jgi:hypothetical protein
MRFRPDTSVVRVGHDRGGYEVGLARSSLTRWFHRHLAPYHKKRWDELDHALTSATRLRMQLFLSRHNPTTRRDPVDYMMETEQFTMRESAIRVANRHLSEMAKTGLVETVADDKIILKRPRPLVVMEPPGIWFSFGLGAGIFFLGLGYLERDLYLIIAATALMVYSAGVIAHLLFKGTPY